MTAHSIRRSSSPTEPPFPPHPQPADGHLPEDSHILLQLSSRIGELEALSGVEVTIQAGVVTLSGVVPTLRDKVHAELLASSLVGVVDVDNQLAVRPSPPRSAHIDKA